MDYCHIRKLLWSQEVLATVLVSSVHASPAIVCNFKMDALQPIFGIYTGVSD